MISRKLLIYLSEMVARRPNGRVELDGDTNPEWAHHYEILMDAGYLKPVPDGRLQKLTFRITHKGYVFLASTYKDDPDVFTGKPNYWIGTEYGDTKKDEIDDTLKMLAKEETACM